MSNPNKGLNAPLYVSLSSLRTTASLHNRFTCFTQHDRMYPCFKIFLLSSKLKSETSISSRPGWSQLSDCIVCVTGGQKNKSVDLGDQLCRGKGGCSPMILWSQKTISAVAQRSQRSLYLELQVLSDNFGPYLATICVSQHCEVYL